MNLALSMMTMACCNAKSMMTIYGELTKCIVGLLGMAFVYCLYISVW